jgi:UDP-glucose 4-epimerase
MVVGMTKFENLKALVAGGAGFIGQSLVKALLRKDRKVRVFDLGMRELKQVKDGRLELIVGDMLDEEAVIEVMDGVDVVYHLALADSFEDFESLIVNLEGTNNLLKAALNAKIKHFLFASSGVVYGSAKRPLIDEDHPLYPEESTIGGRWYPITKFATEKLCMKYFHEYGLPVTALRLGAVYFNVKWTAEPYVSKALKGEKITVAKSEWKEYIHLDDVVEAFLLATLNENSYGEIFNITNPLNCISEQELAGTVVRILKSKSKIEVVEGPHFRARSDITKAQKLLGFKPKKGKNHFIKILKEYLRIAGKNRFNKEGVICHNVQE